MTEFMAYSFLLSHEIDKLAAIFSSAHAAEADVEIENTTARIEEPRSAVFGADTLQSTENDEATGAGTAQRWATLDRDNPGSTEGTFQSAFMSVPVHGKLLGSPAGVTLYTATNQQFAGGPKFIPGTAGSPLDDGNTPSPPITVPPIPPVLVAAELPGFKGLTEFLDGYGLGKATTVFDAEGMVPAKGPVAAALDFAETPLTTLGYWAATGKLAPTSVPLTIDGLSVEWLVQANGKLGDLTTSVNNSRGFAPGELESKTLDDGGSVQGNTASVVDGQDWDGLLVVEGNYYEFNTIIQVNIIWDRDTVSFEHTPAPTGTLSAPAIETGDNEQLNDARILDQKILQPNSQDAEPDVGPETSEIDGLLSDVLPAPSPSQVVLGGQSEYFSVLQINSIIDVDTIDFKAADVFAQLGLSSDLGIFADVKAAGASQINASLIDSSGFDPLGLARLQDMISLVGPSMTKTINGNYYEFNTIIQVNVLYDDDNLADAGAASPSSFGGSGAIASGGNIQFNSATIQKADNFDYLFVKGQYSEFNLVLQLNAIDDSDTISQSVGAPGDPSTPDDVNGSGNSGQAGDDGISDAMLAPSVADASSRAFDLMTV